MTTPDKDPPPTTADVIDRIAAWGRLAPGTEKYKRVMLFTDAKLMTRADYDELQEVANRVEDEVRGELS